MPLDPPSASQTIRGHLLAWWEQGMEGGILYAFEPDAPPTAEKPPYPIFLQNGHFLRIFDPSGTPLWQGTIQLVSRRRWGLFLEKHELPQPIWNNSKQKGLPYRVWISWFWQDPPLRAELTLPAT